MENNLKEWRKKYKELGIPTFLVKGKKPIVDKWKYLQSRLPSDAEIENDLNYEKATGIAGVMGEVSKAMTIDCDIKDPDPKKRCDTEIIKRLKAEGYPETLTGSFGSHFLVRNEPSLGFTSNTSVLPGIDIKAQSGDKAGYIILPPSLALYGQDELEYAHYNGNQYEWIKEWRGEELKPFPAWLLELIKANGKDPNSKKNNKVNLTKAVQGVSEGERDNSAISVAGKLLYGLKREEWKSVGLPMLKGWNLQNTPPLNDSDIERVFDSAMEMESKRREPIFEFEKSLPPEYTELKNRYVSDAGVGILEISRFLIGKYHFKTISGKIDELYVYSNGIYSSEESGKIIKKESQLILQNKFSPHNVNLITGQVAAQTYLDGKRTDFENTSADLICIKNGILNLLTKEVSPHNPDKIFLNKIPVNYNPVADCPKIKEFILNIFNEEDIPTIQEFIGYILYRKYSFKKALILLGERNSGKTTFIQLLNTFVGKENHSTLSLQEISYDDFTTKNLYGKFLNSYDDLSFVGIKSTGRFKAATGNGTISGKVKYGDIINFNNYAKLVFACNKIPQSKEEDLAYYLRWIVIDCPNSFSDDNPKTDKQLISKIATTMEMSGLLNWALEGFERLMANQKFSYGFSDEEIQMIMERSGSNIAGFAQDRLKEGNEKWFSKAAVYSAYEKYIVENKLSPKMTINMVGRELKRYAPYIYDSKKGKITGWRNVSIIGLQEPEETLSPEIEDFFKRNASYQQNTS